MRRLPAIAALAVLAVLVLSAGVARADLCEACRERSYTKDIGECRECRGVTTSGEFALCLACSTKLGQCHHCREKLPESASPTPIDLSKEGTYRVGRWEYRLKIGNPGTRSEGFFGEVRVDDRAVAAAENVNDHLVTPWGLLWWVGNPIVPFGAHGWMPKPAPARPLGRLLPDPAGAVQSVVWMTVLGPGTPSEDRAAPEPWILEALRSQGAAEVVVLAAATPLGTGSVVLHDSKHFGKAEARLVRGRPTDPLVVEVTGAEGPKVELPFRQGATLATKHTMESRFGPHVLYLAFRVEVSSPPEPPPPPSDGAPPR